MAEEIINQEVEKLLVDVSSQFEDMEVFEFLDFLNEYRRKEVRLHISVRWRDENQARRLKAFIENKRRSQERTAVIRGNSGDREDAMEYPDARNALNSGVKWESIDEEKIV